MIKLIVAKFRREIYGENTVGQPTKFALVLIKIYT